MEEASAKASAKSLNVRKQGVMKMGVCESEGPGTDCGGVYTASVILALFSWSADVEGGC